MPLNKSDGPGGKLAYTYLPNQWTTANTTIPSYFDMAEGDWMDQVPGEVTQAHEFCHKFGLRHYDGQPDLMNRKLNTDQHANWGEWTERTLRALYGIRGGKTEPRCAVFELCEEVCPQLVPMMRRALVTLRREVR